MVGFYSRKMVATAQNYFMDKWGKHHFDFWKIVYFYLDLGNESIWFYLGLTLNLISYNFFEVLSPRRCTFYFRENKNRFNR